MIGTDGFTASRKIFEGQNIIFYRAIREADEVPVILKLLKSKQADEDKLSMLGSEIEHACKLNCGGILKPLDISRFSHEPVLVLEDFGGEVLQNILSNGRISIELFLKIAVKLVDIVTCIHNSNMIHRRIRPDSVFVDIENETVKLTGLRDSMETTIGDQIQHEWPGNRYDSAYISPEQTGRVNRKPNYRTDFYSLGVVFYEMLAGVLPFEHEDYTEIVYSHLAVEAVPVSQRNPEVPEVITAIIYKLMQKKVENRYRTAEGLKRDLEECLKRLEFRDNRYEIKAFTIAKSDVPGELYLPKKVLGREKEVKRLLTAFRIVRRNGIPRLVLVSGYSGIGKTTLVNEIRSSIKSIEGSFIQGKYDQYKKNTPYSSIIQAFDIFFDEILVQDKGSVSAWRDQFIHALGINTGIITNIFPRLEKILCTHKHSEAMSFAEAQNRFNTAVIGFLQTVASKEHPLVVFLDDLQWADGSSIRFLEFILSGIEDVYILFVGAYRDNEVGQSHPLQELIERQSELHGSMAEIINLKPLGFEQVRELLEEMLHDKSEETEILARLCSEKTEGNPFFLHQFIKSIKDEGVISYSSVEKKWKINIERVLKHDTTGDIADLIARKVEKLSEHTVEVLKIAACINNTFEADTISKALDAPYGAVETALEEALREGLIMPRDSESYQGKESCVPDRYCFLHDRVQQVVYSLADEEKKIYFHYCIGKQLLKKNPVFEEAESLFEITDHLNLSEGIIGTTVERLLLARLNLESGKRAKNCSAYDRAMDYFMKGMEIVGDDSWDSQYELSRELYTEAAGVAYICGQYELMNRLGDVVLDRSKALIDKAKIYEIRIEYLTVRNKLGEAIETARQVLKLMGINIPVKPTRLDIAAKYLKIRFALIGRTFDDLMNMPEMKDEAYLTIMRLLTSAGIAAYTYSEPVMLMLTLNVVHISLKHGIAPLTPVAYTGYGHFLCAYLKKRELGYRFGKLAIDLQSAMESKAYECKTNLLFEILIRHNKEHIGNTLNGFPDNHRKGLNSGDLTSAGHIMMQHFVYTYLAGRELNSIRKEMEDYRGDLQRTGNRTSISVSMMYLQGIENLLEAFEKPWELKGQYFNEEEELSHYKAVNDRTVIFNSYFNKMFLSYLFGHYEEALKSLEIVKEYFDGAIGTYCIPVYNFYGTLIHLEMLSTANLQRDKHAHRKQIDTYLREVKGYCKDAPENNENKYFLIKAVQSHVYGNDEQAMRYCDESIQAAGKYGFLQEEALANEIAAKIAYSTGKEETSKSYVKAAVYCYSKWGCPLKAELLQTEYLNVDMEDGRGMGKDAAGVDFISTQQLDVESIVKASQAISEEIVIQELMKKMIRIVLQNAGASKALFITETDGELYIEAKGTADDKEIKIIQGAEVKGNPEVSEKLVNYVLNTGESIILNSEAEIERFTGEKPGHGKGARSLFCMPVKSKRRLIGFLYLENDLIDGAFTGQHMLVLKVLASQLAISMENARLYQSMERMVDERTEQLKIKNYELECANNKLVNANRIKDEFLANMSHEMRTPLHGVIGLAGMLQKGSLDPGQKETVNSIMFSARSLLETINEILDFSKIEANRVELEEQDFDLDQLLKELLPSFTQTAEEKGIALACQVKPETVKTLRGDTHRIKQIMANLLSNAVKFTERGKVELAVSVAESRDANVVMEISVKDSGIGIPNHKLSHIFEDFVQADSSTTRKFGGTGLGLSITKRLVEMMNGTINVDSKPGKGSTFTCSIQLTLSDGGGDRGIPGLITGEDAHSEEPLLLKILVAEDDAISYKYLKALLEYEGCSVTLASNGLEVLEKLKSDAFDCILMDKNMPDLDGIGATKIIRRNETGTGRHIPIIALTASAIIGDREKLLLAGMDYYLSKPVNEQELLEILKAVKNSTAIELLEIEFLETVENELIDRKTFFEEAELYGEEVMLEIISVFLKDYGDVLSRIEAAIGKADFISVGKEVHRFASTVSIFHCSSIVSLLKAMERTATEEGLDSLASTYPTIKDMVIRLVQELEGVSLHLSSKKGL